MSEIISYLDKYNLVKQIPVFSKLNWFETQRITRRAIVEGYRKGEIISREGSPPDYCYCLISGRVQVYVTKDNRHEKIDFIHRGMIFGIISTLTGENHSKTFEAVNDSVVLKIPKEDFHSIIKTIPNLGLQFGQMLSARLRSSQQGVRTVFESVIISIYSPIKGIGNSTYAFNLALSLAKETKKKVIFVNINSKQNLVTVKAKDGSSSDNALSFNIKKYPIGLDGIFNSYEKIKANISNVETSLDIINVVLDAENADSKKHISPFISMLGSEYHYVIVDLPDKMDDVVSETLNQSDFIHLITSDDKQDFDIIPKAVDNLRLSLKDNFREEKLRIIFRTTKEKMSLSSEEINKVIGHRVYKFLPEISLDELEVKIDSENIYFLNANNESEYIKVLREISREIGGVRVGLVLGGGAALGVSHIGVIKVLEKEDIPIDIVVGSSMGALIAGLWVTGRTYKEVEDIAREFEKKINMFKLADLGMFFAPFSGLISGNAIRRWLKKHLGHKTFYDLDIPLKVVAYDLVRREDVVIDSGSLVDAIMKSIAIPGVIKPSRNEEQVIIDGGVLNPLPTSVLVALGIEKIIAVNVLQSPQDCSKGFDIAKQKLDEKLSIPFYKYPLSYILIRLAKFLSWILNPSIPDIIVRTLQASEYVLAEQSGRQADVLIHPDLIGFDWFELNKVKELIHVGEKAAQEHLAQIKNLVEK